HLASCPACRTRIDALGEEARPLRAVSAEEERDVAIPAFRKIARRQGPLGTARRQGPLGAAAVLIALASGPFAVAAVLRRLGLAASLPTLDSFTGPEAVDLFLVPRVFIGAVGGSLLTSTIDTAGAAVVVALLVAAALAVVRKGAGAAVFAAALAAITFSTQSDALEVRRSDGVVSVAAGETIDDTLIAMGREVEIN